MVTRCHRLLIRISIVKLTTVRYCEKKKVARKETFVQVLNRNYCADFTRPKYSSNICATINRAMSNGNIIDSFKRTLNKLRAGKIDAYQKDRLMMRLEELAYKDKLCSEGIVETIRAYVDNVDPDTKIWIIDLVYIIISSHRGVFGDHFNEHIVDIFFSAYIHAGSIDREKLFEKREHWDSYFPKKVLKDLDDTIRRIDRSYPVVPKRSVLISRHKERIALLHEVQALTANRNMIKADLKRCQPVPTLNPIDKLVPIIAEPSENEAPAKRFKQATKAEVLQPIEGNSLRPQASGNVALPMLQPIRGISNEKLIQNSPNIRPNGPRSLTDDNTTSTSTKNSIVGESIDDDRIKAILAEMMYVPPVIGPLGELPLSFAIPNVSQKNEPKEMNIVAGTSMNGRFKRPISALKPLKPIGIENRSKITKKRAPPSLLEKYRMKFTKSLNKR